MGFKDGYKKALQEQKIRQISEGPDWVEDGFGDTPGTYAGTTPPKKIVSSGVTRGKYAANSGRQGIQGVGDGQIDQIISQLFGNPPYGGENLGAILSGWGYSFDGLVENLMENWNDTLEEATWKITLLWIYLGGSYDPNTGPQPEAINGEMLGTLLSKWGEEIPDYPDQP